MRMLRPSLMSWSTDKLYEAQRTVRSARDSVCFIVPQPVHVFLVYSSSSFCSSHGFCSWLPTLDFRMVVARCFRRMILGVLWFSNDCQSLCLLFPVLFAALLWLPRGLHLAYLPLQPHYFLLVQWEAKGVPSVLFEVQLNVSSYIDVTIYLSPTVGCIWPQ